MLEKKRIYIEQRILAMQAQALDVPFSVIMEQYDANLDPLVSVNIVKKDNIPTAYKNEEEAYYSCSRKRPMILRHVYSKKPIKPTKQRICTYTPDIALINNVPNEQLNFLLHPKAMTIPIESTIFKQGSMNTQVVNFNFPLCANNSLPSLNSSASSPYNTSAYSLGNSMSSLGTSSRRSWDCSSICTKSTMNTSISTFDSSMSSFSTSMDEKIEFESTASKKYFAVPSSRSKFQQRKEYILRSWTMQNAHENKKLSSSNSHGYKLNTKSRDSLVKISLPSSGYNLTKPSKQRQ